MEKIKYEILVVGGGHAGIEASISSSKMGLKTLLITNLVDNIGAVSCNPAIGGLGKGHLVKDIDALGGVMGKIADKASIQFRKLNESKGPAVRGSRAQIDMDRYKIYAKEECFNAKNLSILQDEVISLILDNNEVIGVKGKLKDYFAKKVILTTGTFLNAMVHIGELKSSNGRFGEASSNALGNNLKKIGFEVGRLKTGTCPRIDAKSINYNLMDKHYSDDNIVFFSKKTKAKILDDRCCYIIYTNKNTHDIIKSNFDRAPLFTGQIEGVGPRYCPSIEDKINRFRDKERHQLFLEPQTMEAKEYYINGMSTSLPIDVQESMVRSIKGLEKAVITRYGYAIEYDYINPISIKNTLETKLIKSLYFAGQINGTTGYEEAAAQGLYAGINASLSLLGEEAMILNRSESYIGVLVDDLTTKGTIEPYRMFTSRAEYRLLLREDNADLRLGKIGYKIGMIDKETLEYINKKEKNINIIMNYLHNKFVTPNKEFLIFLEEIEEEYISDKTSMISLIARKNFDKYKLEKILEYFRSDIDITLNYEEKEQILIECKYYSYLEKQKKQINNMSELLKVKIPENMNFYNMPGISKEIAEKLTKYNPSTLFNALNISGVTPAAIEVLEIYIKRVK